MPTDKSGKFHLSSQRAHASDRMGAKPSPLDGSSPEHGGESMASTTLHDHGDGTFHTEGHDGEQAQHPTFEDAMEHMRAKHGGGMAHGGNADCSY